MQFNIENEKEIYKGKITPWFILVENGCPRFPPNPISNGEALKIHSLSLF